MSMRMILDEAAPVLAGDPFIARGHIVIRHHEVCEPGASDETVVATAILNKAILIAVDRDMARYTRRFGSPKGAARFPTLNLIHVACKEVMAAKRLEHAMTFIENEWSVTLEKPTRRLWIDVDAHRLTTNR